MVDFPRTKAVIGRGAASIPPMIYHYTSPAGLLGILQSRSIWLSSRRYLNDASELDYALSLSKGIIEKLGGPGQPLNSILNRVLSGIEDSELCVASFSEVDRLVSQWRAYCPPSGGYALGFNGGILGAGTPCLLTPCIYKPEEQVYVLNTIFEEHLDAVRGVDDLSVGEHGNTAVSLIAAVATVLPAIKHPAFEDEREWRLVLRAEDGDSEIEFRTAGSQVIPYRSVPLDRNSRNALPLEEIVIGPNPDPQRARSAARSIVSRFGPTKCELRAVDIPYRPW